MADRLGAKLERHFQRSAYRAESDLVFCQPQSGHAYDSSKLRTRFGAVTERTGAWRITFHELRRTFGTQMAPQTPLCAPSRSSWVADAKTTEVYAHYPPDATNGATFAERAFAIPSAANGAEMLAPAGQQVPRHTASRGHRAPNARGAHELGQGRLRSSSASSARQGGEMRSGQAQLADAP